MAGPSLSPERRPQSGAVRTRLLTMSIRFEPPRCLTAPCVLLLWTLAVLLPAPGAGAALEPASLIDGPSPTILDVDGGALAPDGTGGILYRKLVGGQPHLFVARFIDGA